MEGISYLTNEAGQKKAVVIDIALLKDRDNLVEILEDIEDGISIDLRKNEELVNWDDVRDTLMTED
jgi:hypothetical protein